MLKNRKDSVAANFIIAALCTLGVIAPAQAGENDFFGSSVPGGAGAAQAQSQQTANPYADPTVPRGDYTTDEKRMQKKYKASIQHCKGLIAKGERMMESGQRGHNDKDFKKGKILKEIGEKQLAELNANNPLADILDDKSIEKKPKTATTQTTTTQ